MASRSGRAPQVTAYWLMSAWMAAQAASLIRSGAGKSGNPCDRFTPPYNSLRRVISRMTDSVNCVAFLDPVSLDIPGGILRCLARRAAGGLLFFRRRLVRRRGFLLGGGLGGLGRCAPARHRRRRIRV